MALTPLRWVAAAVVGFVVVASLALRDTEPRWHVPDPVTRGLEKSSTVARYQVTAAAEQLRIAQLRDSIGRVAGGSPAPFRISFGAGISAATRATLDSAVQVARSRRPDRAAVGVDVIFVLDTATAIRGVNRHQNEVEYDYLLPGAATGGRCVSLVRLGRKWLSRAPSQMLLGYSSDFEDQADLLLGPCSYYAAFGQPGAPLTAFLQQRGYRFLRGGSWSAGPQPLPVIPASLTRGYLANNWSFVSRTAPEGQACAAGDLRACTDALFDSTSPNRWRPWDSTGVLSTGIASMPGVDPFARMRFGLGMAESHLFADMERSIGRERFTRFWRSNAPVDAAFREVAGVSIGEWTRDWAQSMYGERPRGADITGSNVAFGTVLSLLAIGAAVVAARRRTVG